MPQVPVQRINLSPAENFVAQVYPAALANGLPPAAAQLLLAHISLSTGWGKAADNYRLAGMKANADWQATRPYTVVQGFECKAGGEPAAECPEGTGKVYSQMYWRAYNNLTESVGDILASLRGSRYASAYALLLAGDTEYFAEVGRNGWYTADPNVMKSSMTSRLRTIQQILVDGGGGSISGSLLPLVALGYAGYRLWKLYHK